MSDPVFMERHILVSSAYKDSCVPVDIPSVISLMNRTKKEGS